MRLLDKIKLVHSPLTDTIFLYRHGKDVALALDKREAEADVMAVLVAHMMHNAPRGSEKVITLGERKYTIRVTPLRRQKTMETISYRSDAISYKSIEST